MREKSYLLKTTSERKQILFALKLFTIFERKLSVANLEWIVKIYYHTYLDQECLHTLFQVYKVECATKIPNHEFLVVRLKKKNAVECVLMLLDMSTSDHIVLELRLEEDA